MNQTKFSCRKLIIYLQLKFRFYYSIFISFDKTNDTYLQAMKTEFLKTFNATCPSNQASIVNQRIPFANQQQVNFLCNLISYGVNDSNY